MASKIREPLFSVSGVIRGIVTFDSLSERSVNIRTRREKTGNPNAAVLFYDGTCGFCNGMVRFILDHERSNTLRYATLHGKSGAALIKRHPYLSEIDSVIWVEPGAGRRTEQVFVRSDAALRVASYLGGFWRIGVLGCVIPRLFRDAVYDFVARHRHRLTRRPASCRVLSGQDRSRFLD